MPRYRRTAARSERRYVSAVSTPASSRHHVSLDDRCWWVDRLWDAARDLPVIEVSLDQVRELDEDCWFAGDGRTPTVRAVADHARQIQSADLERPILLATDGQILDGMHRLARAYLEGRPLLPAKQFPVDPEPDWRLSDGTSSSD